MIASEYWMTKEAIDLGNDPESGARITQLTSAPLINANMYGEQPFMDAESRFVLFSRSLNSYGPVEIWRVDMRDFMLRYICDGALRRRCLGISPDHRYFFCTRMLDGGFEVVRTDVVTLEQVTYPFKGEIKPTSMLGFSSDNRLGVCGVMLSDTRFGILKLDFETQTSQIIHEGPELVNPHVQVEPGKGEDIMVQHNRGSRVEGGKVVRLVGEEGATLYLIDWSGGNLRTLPVGKPYTTPCQGHQCWIGKTGEILLTVAGGASEETISKGILLAVKPGDEKARVVAKGYRYQHPNASRDGRFFVSDVAGDALIVGSIKTGKTRALCTGFSPLRSSPQYAHPHPYFSPDNKWVIFNSISTGIPHVCAASVPEGMLEELASQ